MKNLKTLSLILFLTLFSAVSFAKRPLRGSYSVPITEAQVPDASERALLESFSHYPVKFHSESYPDSGEVSSMEFPLPIELTGVPQSIKMNLQADGSWLGDKSQGTCQYSGRYFICDMKFQNLNFDPAAADAAIGSGALSPDEKAAKIEISRLFMDEPRGIIKYRLRGRASH